MRKILYTATDKKGKEVTDFVETSSNKAAIEKLTAEGFSNIRFHDDVVTAMHRSDLEDLSKNELKRIAKFEAATRLKPSFITFINEVIRVNKYLIIGGIAFVTFGIYTSNIYLIGIGLLLGLSMPLLSLWNYRVVSGYDKLLRAFATGQTDKALNLINTLEKHMKQPELAFDLDIRRAALRALDGNIEEEIQVIAPWRNASFELSPGMYESRIASIYHLAGNNEQYLEKMRDAFFKSSQSPTLILDLAMAEARLGDYDKAELLLKNVNPQELPIHGAPFIHWTKGAIKFRKGDPTDETELFLAVSGLLEFAENPAVWPSLAVCIGDYAACARSEPALKKAEQLLQNVWDVLRFHGESELIDELLSKFPGLKH